MDAKSAVATALSGKTPDQKITIACTVLGKDVEMYAHLDNGRRSMTAGNLLRTAISKDESLLALLKSVSSTVGDVVLERTGEVVARGKRTKEPEEDVQGGGWVGSQEFTGVVIKGRCYRWSDCGNGCRRLDMVFDPKK